MKFSINELSILDSKEFSIDKETGLVMLADEVDREERSSYLLNVTVTDHAAHPLSASTFVEIVLDDGKFCFHQLLIGFFHCSNNFRSLYHQFLLTTFFFKRFSFQLFHSIPFCNKYSVVRYRILPLSLTNFNI